MERSKNSFLHNWQVERNSFWSLNPGPEHSTPCEVAEGPEPIAETFESPSAPTPTKFPQPCGRKRPRKESPKGRAKDSTEAAERAEERLPSLRPGQSPCAPSLGPAPRHLLRPAGPPGPVIIRLRAGDAASAPGAGQSPSSAPRSRHRPNNQTEKFNKQRTEGLAAAGPERAGVRWPHLCPFHRRRPAAAGSASGGEGRRQVRSPALGAGAAQRCPSPSAPFPHPAEARRGEARPRPLPAPRAGSGGRPAARQAQQVGGRLPVAGSPARAQRLLGAEGRKGPGLALPTRAGRPRPRAGFPRGVSHRGRDPLLLRRGGRRAGRILSSWEMGFGGAASPVGRVPVTRTHPPGLRSFLDCFSTCRVSTHRRGGDAPPGLDGGGFGACRCSCWRARGFGACFLSFETVLSSLRLPT